MRTGSIYTAQDEKETPVLGVFVYLGTSENISWYLLTCFEGESLATLMKTSSLRHRYLLPF